MKKKLVSLFKKEPTKRALRTFGQAAVGYIFANIAFVDLTSGKDVAKSALIGLGVSAIAAGAAALMNLKKIEEEV